MPQLIARREWLGAVGAAAVVSTASRKTSGAEIKSKRKIIGICCSPRKGMTTSSALAVCLQSVMEHNPNLETELIELGEFCIPAQLAAGQPLRDGEKDDFPKIVEKLSDPTVAGIVVGSPVYFSNMSALCKAFLDRCIVFRKDGFKLRNKIAGVLAVGGSRNGGQELTVQSIQASLLCHEMIIVGAGQPSARIGAMLLNQNNSIDDDAYGIATAKDLGKRVAEMATILER